MEHPAAIFGTEGHPQTLPEPGESGSGEGEDVGEIDILSKISVQVIDWASNGDSPADEKWVSSVPPPAPPPAPRPPPPSTKGLAEVVVVGQFPTGLEGRK